MINALIAVDAYGGMGFNGTMPWPKNSADLKNFQNLTIGHVVVMGRRTWEDRNMPKPLPGRITYVATNKSYLPNTAIIKGDIQEEVLKIEQQHEDKIVWVIGGPELLEQCGDIFDKLYLTHYKGSYKIDTKIELKSFLTGFTPVRAEVSQDHKATFVKYAPIFKRITTSS